MNEQPLLPPPDEARDPIVVKPKQPAGQVLPWLCALGFLILAGAIYYVWQNPLMLKEEAGDTAAFHDFEQRLSSMDPRVSRLEQRLSEMDARVTQFDQRLTELNPRVSQFDQRLSEMDTRVKSVEQRPIPDIGKLTARVDELDTKFADQAQIASRLDTLSGRIESLSARDQTAFDANKRQVDQLTGRVTAQEATAGALGTVTKRLDRVAKLQEASLALAFGRPVGDLPDAPDALTRYAHTAPPTEAQLRLHFAQAQQDALATKQPGTEDAPFLDRAWERAQGLVTVRQGGDVVVGNTSSTALGQARAALEVGDLAGAVSAVETLQGRPKDAMANWLNEAKGLLNARAALAAMADQA